MNIYSTLRGGAYMAPSGTLMASPHVAGAAALVIAFGISDANGHGVINDEVRQVSWLGFIGCSPSSAPAPPWIFLAASLPGLRLEPAVGGPRGEFQGRGRLRACLKGEFLPQIAYLKAGYRSKVFRVGRNNRSSCLEGRSGDDCIRQANGEPRSP